MANNNQEIPAILTISKIPKERERAFSSEITFMPMNLESAYPTIWKMTNQDLYVMLPNAIPSKVATEKVFRKAYTHVYKENAVPAA